MFYSVDLLSKKSALGQIWITAVLNAKVTRKKAGLIDLTSVCAKIREPEVPIALRLSGILMGGVTRVYNSKVLFLWEDANVLMARITENYVTSKTTSKRAAATTDKSRARFDAVTNAYDFAGMEMPPPGDESGPRPRDFFREFVELPDVPLTTDGNAQEHRAAREEVTLPDIQQAPLFDANFDELLPPAADFEMDDNAPPPADFELGAPGAASPVPDGPDANAPGGETGAPGAGRRRPRPEDGEDVHQEQRQQPKRQRRRRTRTSADALIDEETQLPSARLQSWLRDPSDIIRSGRRCMQEATPKEVLHGLLTVPALYSSIDEGGRVTSNFPPDLRGVFAKIANLARTGEGAAPAEPMGVQEQESVMDSPRPGSAMSGDSVERRRGREQTPDYAFGRDSPRAGGLFSSDDAQRPRSARSAGTPDSVSSQGQHVRNIPRDGPSPPLGELHDLGFGMDLDMNFPEAVPESFTLKSIFTQADTLPETFESEHTQRQQHISRRTARFARHFQTEVFLPGKPMSVSFRSLLSKCNRHQAAVSFAEVLALATRGYIRVRQEAPYGAIEIRQGNQ